MSLGRDRGYMTSPQPTTGKRSLDPETEDASRKRLANDDVVEDIVVNNGGLRLRSRLTEFRREGKLIDVTVVCGAREFPCHRSVLAAGSDYFLTLFEIGLADSTSAVCNVSTEEVQPEALAKALDFIYEGSVRCDYAGLQPLGAAASYLRIDALLQNVAMAMKARITVSTCVVTWMFADMYSLRELAAEASAFAAKSFQALSEYDTDPGSSLTALPTSLMMSLLAMESLRPRAEQVVYEVGLRWIRAQSTPLSDEDTATLLAHVRFALLPKATADNLLAEPLLAGPACRTLLLQAFIPAAHGVKAEHRFPDSLEAAKALGFSPARCLEYVTPLELYRMCKPAVVNRAYTNVEVVTASGLRGTFVALHRPPTHHWEPPRWEYRFTLTGGATGAPSLPQASPINIQDVHLLEWS